MVIRTRSQAIRSHAYFRECLCTWSFLTGWLEIHIHLRYLLGVGAWY